jgi:hypothetical protein
MNRLDWIPALLALTALAYTGLAALIVLGLIVRALAQWGGAL